MYIKCSKKMTSGRIGVKKQVSSAQQHTCMPVIDDQIVCCQAQCVGLLAFALFLGLVNAWLPPVPGIKKCSERTTVCECWVSHCKSDQSNDRGVEKWFQGMLSEALQTLAKVCHCPRELLWRKCCANKCKVSNFCVNKCKVTNFCVINQFWEFF
jgi:hypothetical protein